MSGLGPEQRERYKRHLLLDGVGPEGQTALLSSSVLVIGAGGLGSPALLYLAAAGVGRIGIVDFDDVDGSNLPLKPPGDVLILRSELIRAGAFGLVRRAQSLSEGLCHGLFFTQFSDDST